MKKILALIIALVMVLGLAACSNGGDSSVTADDNAGSTAEVVTDVNSGSDSSDAEADSSTADVDADDSTADGEAEADDTDSGEAEEPAVTIRLAGMTGPTAMGMTRILADNEDGLAANNYEFTLAGAADEITPLLIKGELDIAAVPVNLASVLYNNTEGGVQILAVNTLGVIYILDNSGNVADLKDLVGKTIYATGKGSTPEYTLRYLLSQNGIDPDKDVTIEWKSEPAEIVAIFKQAEGEVIAMMPQPYVTVAQTSVEGINIAISLTDEWNKLNNGSLCMTGCVVVRKEFAEQYPQAVARFLEEYAASVAWVNENVEEAADLMEHFGIVKAAVAKKAIPYCNLVCLAGEDLKFVEGYLQVLFDQNPKAVGGAMPADDFYYGR